MTDHTESTLERLARLEKALSEVRHRGLEGEQLAQRIEGDLMRQMNSALLSCADLNAVYDRLQNGALPVAYRSATEYAIDQPDGLAFLKCWQEGDWEAVRERWPDAPPLCFVSKELIL